MHFLGIDIGTSAVKAVLVDESQTVVAEASVAVATQQPRPGWSEQDPEEAWRGSEAAVAKLRAANPDAMHDVAAIGLSGQMHGAILLDDHDRPIRPAILWNDGRATEECAELAAAVPDLPRIAGVLAMPGFTAPKIRWLARHEPEHFAHTRRIVLAKDLVRLRMTGEAATDMTDAAGTLFLDEAARAWSPAIVTAAGLDMTQMPTVMEGSAPSGRLRPAVAAAWGIGRPVVVAAGAGDAAAGAIGIGAVEEGDSFLSLGTSAQLFVTRDRYEPKPETLVHAFAHALPGRWFEMAAMLNGAVCLDWVARLIGVKDIAALVASVAERFRGPARVVFLPYLAGERTPHNDPEARGGFFGLEYATGPLDLAQAVLEGIVFSFIDAQLALQAAGRPATPVLAVGGGARSRFWLKLIASGLGQPVLVAAGADTGPAFGAARLARLALSGATASELCRKPGAVETVAPDAGLHAAYRERFAIFRDLYSVVRGSSRAATADRPPAARR